MTNVELLEKVCQLAADGTPPLKAFMEMTKGPDGIKGLKREEFEKEFAQLTASPLLRRLKTRVAREDEFRSKLAEAVMKVDCPEEVAPDIAKSLQDARENPKRVPACLAACEAYLSPETTSELLAAAKALWPQVFEKKETP